MRKRPLIIIYATCQGEYLSQYLACSPALSERFELVYLSNISRPGVFCPVEIDVDILRRCVLLLYHKVRSPRNMAAVQGMLAQVPAGAVAVPLPYVTSSLYWPFMDSKLNPLGVDAQRPVGVFPFRFPALDTLIGQGLTAEESRKRFLALHPAEALDLPALQQRTFAYWDSLDREGEGYLSIASFLKENWRDRLLFYLYNHPSQYVFLHLSNQILHLLGLPQLSFEHIRKVRCAQDSIYALDPRLAAYWRMGFGGAGSRYPLDGQLFSYPTFLDHYIQMSMQEAQGKGQAKASSHAA